MQYLGKSIAFGVGQTSVRALVPMVRAVFGVPGTAPSWHTPWPPLIEEQTIWSLLDKSMTICRKEDKFEGKGQT